MLISYQLESAKKSKNKTEAETFDIGQEFAEGDNDAAAKAAEE